HLSNTPKQMLLYQALNWSMPRFGHIPMILGPDKKRLSKRHGAVSIQQFREDGILPEALVNYLARLGWAHGDQEIFTRAELTEAFGLEGVGKSACVFDYAKLEWLNGEWIRKLGPVEMARRARPLWLERGWITPDEPDERLIGIASTLVERATRLTELVDKARFYFDLPLTWDDAARSKHLTAETGPLLMALADRLDSLPEWTHESVEATFRALASERGLKAGAVIQPARVALTGSTVSPGMFEVIVWLGRERTLARLHAVLNPLRTGAGITFS
ncbi:MAG: glutamate--tRNA ligase, partial [Cyanobacteria bacterium REEB65]|nr:glutamate--tRNA ligase [Cyanobacteria bacterium REEB65]